MGCCQNGFRNPDIQFLNVLDDNNKVNSFVDIKLQSNSVLDDPRNNKSIAEKKTKPPTPNFIEKAFLDEDLAKYQKYHTFTSSSSYYNRMTSNCSDRSCK